MTKANTTPEVLKPIDVMIRQMGISKITASSMLARFDKATVSKLEGLAAKGAKSEFAALVYDAREGVVEKDKAVQDVGGEK